MVATAIDLYPHASLNDEVYEQRIAPRHLAGVLESLGKAKAANRIPLAPEVADNARIAPHRKLEI